LDLSGTEFSLTGIDISKEALEIRKRKCGDLDKIIIGDLTSIKLRNSEYDIIYCSYVLEHINNAENLLTNFFRWLKPNGLLVIFIPDRDTVKGFITRIAPFRFHILYTKYFKKRINAGKPGYAPFATPFDKVVSKQGINDYCQRRGHKIHIEYGKELKHKRPIWAPVFFIIFKFIELISFGKITSKHCDLIYVIEKNEI
jgi:ubiquinone/menaquinone biosynthesis C-methylase UbiE